MESYSKRAGHEGHFEVTYRFFPSNEGGRMFPAHQHLRCDFMYEGDDIERDGLSIIWPEFIDSAGFPCPAGEVPSEGSARMFILNPERVSFHRRRIQLGTRGFFMEGSRRVAECQVTAVIALGRESAA